MVLTLDGEGDRKPYKGFIAQRDDSRLRRGESIDVRTSGFAVIDMKSRSTPRLMASEILFPGSEPPEWFAGIPFCKTKLTGRSAVAR